jgi:ADYC domain
VKHEVVALLALAACVVEEPEELATTSQAVRGEDCDKLVCGTNSPELTNGFFHELNLDGHPNAEGYSITALVKNGSYYKMNVVNGKISATMTMGHVGAPTYLAGDALEGSYIRLKRVVAGETTYRRITISSVARSTDYFAIPMDGDPTPNVETYLFVYGNDASPPPNVPQMSAYVCADGALLHPTNSSVDPMPWRHALVFEGDRIDARNLRVDDTIDSRWFNIGCAETALAKLHLNGMTQASRAAGFASTSLMRQAFLKMITGDYCDRGSAYLFTVPGQHVHYRDILDTMTLPEGRHRLEARWNADGAYCLNIPRLEENPSTAGTETWPHLDASITMACNGSPPPPCVGSSNDWLFLSYNPI